MLYLLWNCIPELVDWPQHAFHCFYSDIFFLTAVVVIIFQDRKYNAIMNNNRPPASCLTRNELRN